MSHIVEVKFLEQTLLLTCETTTTISQLGNLALLEYEQAYLDDTPKTIRHVKDAKGRILSGSIQLVALNLDKYVEVVLNEEDSTRALDPSAVKAMYHRWQSYTARQMEMYFQNLASGATPSAESLQVLDDLKISTAHQVQSLVLHSYEQILKKSRNSIITQPVTDSIHAILRSTDSFDIASSALQLLRLAQTLPCCSLNSPQLMLDLHGAMRRFPSRAGDIVAMCESMSLSVPHTSPPTHAPHPHTASPPTNPIASENSPRLGVTDDIDGTGRPGSSSSGGGGMSLERILELLDSEDTRCRAFALEKITRSEEMKAESSDKSTPSFLRIVVAESASNTGRKSGALNLLRSLFSCLKKSLQPPDKPPSRSAATPSAPMAYLIADSTLRSQGTQMSAVLSCLRLLYMLVILLHEGGEATDSLEEILGERWRLLLTLAHAHERRDSELCHKSSDILLLLVSSAGWNKYRIKLDRDSVVYFLDSEGPIPRTYLAIEFLLHCMSGTSPTQGHGGALREVMEQTGGSPWEQDDAIESLLCHDNFLLLRALWRWSVGNYRPDITMKAMEVLSLAAGSASIKRFLVKFDAVDKVRRSSYVMLTVLMPLTLSFASC